MLLGSPSGARQPENENCGRSYFVLAGPSYLFFRETKGERLIGCSRGKCTITINTEFGQLQYRLKGLAVARVDAETHEARLLELLQSWPVETVR